MKPEEASMNMPRLFVLNGYRNAKRAKEIVIRNPTDEIRKVSEQLGFTIDESTPNRIFFLCYTVEQFDAVRDPLRKYFDPIGDYIGK